MSTNNLVSWVGHVDRYLLLISRHVRRTDTTAAPHLVTSIYIGTQSLHLKIEMVARYHSDLLADGARPGRSDAVAS